MEKGRAVEDYQAKGSEVRVWEKVPSGGEKALQIGEKSFIINSFCNKL